MKKRIHRLAIFALVVEEGSFAAAARRLGRAPSAVSAHIAALEEAIGARLLHRTTRRLALTEVGERYLAHAQTILDGLRAADRLTADLGDAVRGPLRVSAPTALVEVLVVPAMQRLLATHPDVEVTLSATDARVDLRGGEVDVAVRVGHLTGLDDRARRLGALHDVRVRRADGVDRAIVLPWQSTRSGAAGRARASTVMAARAMVRSGLGWAELPETVVRADLAAGRLEAIGEARAVPVYATHAFGHQPPATVRAFIAAAVEAAAPLRRSRADASV